MGFVEKYGVKNCFKIRKGWSINVPYIFIMKGSLVGRCLKKSNLAVIQEPINYKEYNNNVFILVNSKSIQGLKSHVPKD